MKTFVYFVTAGPFVKIGLSASPMSRIDALQPWCPLRMELRLLFRGGRSDEAAFHWVFLEYAERGEWFRVEGRLKDFIEEHASVSYPPDEERAILDRIHTIWDTINSRQAAQSYMKAHDRRERTASFPEDRPFGPLFGDVVRAEYRASIDRLIPLRERKKTQQPEDCE